MERVAVDSTLETRWSLVNFLYDTHGIELDYEGMLSANFSRLIPNGAWVVDVGAHLGRHTTPIAEIVGPHGRVLAVEPLEYFAGILEGKFADVAHVDVRGCALSNFEGSATFIVARGTPEESGLRRKNYIYPDRADPVEVSVKVELLDPLVEDWPRLDYIKLDIEGAELDCLAGAGRALARHRPIISFECGRNGYGEYGKVAEDFVSFAVKHNMRIFDMFGYDLTEMDRWLSVVDRAHTWDFYYVPEEKAESFAKAIYVPPLP